jgi:small nuclear ribonucleoprotein
MPHHNPIDQLNRSLGKSILIKCKRSKVFKGILKSYDPHLNVLIEDVSYSHFERNEDKTMEEHTEKINRIVLRGDSIVFIGLSS